MRLFHRTDVADSILRDGSRDATGTYFTNRMRAGVWLSNVPLDVNEGTNGEALLEIHLPDQLAAEYEWVEEGKPYREFLVPAAVLNRFGPPRIVTDDERR